MNDQPHPSETDVDLDTEERDDAVIGSALRWSLIVLLLLVSAGGGLAYWLTRPEPPPVVKQTELVLPEVRELPPVEIPLMNFTDVTADAGISFVHENGASGAKLLPETMGSGCAFLDFDNDGDQDILFVNSRRWAGDDRPEQRPATMGVYENDGKGRFTNVTAEVGLDVSIYGMGAAVGDYDNDGQVDVFISAVGSNRLFHNIGGKFVDVTADAGIAGGKQEWSTSCGWFDYDNDGDLDLMVCNYVVWSKEFDLSQDFQLTGGGRAYGRPQDFQGTYPYLYRNDGAGKFTDVSKTAGVQVANLATGRPMAKSLGLTFADFDSDGRIDVVVANDTVQNFMFHNQEDGSFAEVGALVGIAFDSDGNARGAMGIDVARFRNNDSLGIAIGNFSNEMTALYVANRNELQFTDEGIPTGLGPSTRLELTFGLFYADFDLDGRLDLFSANGHLEADINKVLASQHYEQPPQLFWNCGPEHPTEFLPVETAKCGEDFSRPIVGRAASFADIDGDGDIDILMTASGGKPRLLRNDQELGNHWIRFQLTGTKSNRNAIGAWVEVHVDGKVLRQQVMPTRSYLSQSELPVTFGLGESTTIDKVTVLWPGGSTQAIRKFKIDQLNAVRQQADKEK